MMTWPGGFETLRKNGTLGLSSLTAVDNHGFAQSAKYANGRVTEMLFGKWKK